MAVAVVIGLVAVKLLAHEIREPTDAVDVAAAIERHAVLGVQPFAGRNFLGDWKQ